MTPLSTLLNAAEKELDDLLSNKNDDMILDTADEDFHALLRSHLTTACESLVAAIREGVPTYDSNEMMPNIVAYSTAEGHNSCRSQALDIAERFLKG